MDWAPSTAGRLLPADDAPDVADAVPVGGAAKTSLKAQAEDAQKAIAADADLDELD